MRTDEKTISSSRSKDGEYTSSSSSCLEDVFHQAAQLVREPSEEISSSEEGESNIMNNDMKLNLYGLYKFVMDGPCCSSKGGVSEPSIFQIVARSKYQAWEAASRSSSGRTRETAMKEYVTILASQNNSIGKKCQIMLESLCMSDKNNTEQATTTTSDDQNLKKAMVEQKTEQKEEVHYKEDVLPVTKNFTTTASSIPPKISSLKNNITKSTDDINFSILQKWFQFVLGYLGIRSLVPRGILDISFQDLFWSLIQCFISSSNSASQERQLISKISNVWKDAATATHKNHGNNKYDEDVGEIVVGLSVRSIFDVYLCSKSYPMNSEIIIFPPINVPGMMYVARYHSLNVVGVDIGSGEAEEKTGERGWWNWEEISKSITKYTVAIMIVHPFGNVSISSDQFEQLRRLADEHKLELWEDCAECFMGLGENCYLGSPLVDIRFFSFGPIKTATALGGGVALFKNIKEGKHIQQLHSALPRRQTNYQFCKRILLSICLNYVAKSPLRVGILQSFLSSFGLSYDTVVTKSIRSFKLPNKNDYHQDLGNKNRQQQQQQDRLDDFMKQIRKQPCIPLLKLLLRRVQQSSSTAPSVSFRLRRCQQLKSLLESEISPQILFSDAPNFCNTYWAFPIKCSGQTDRDIISRNLVQRGFDVASGASQLCCISKFTNNTSQCPRAQDLMDSILYLPISCQEVQDMPSFVNCLKDVFLEAKGKPNYRRPASGKKSLPTIATALATACFLLNVQFEINLVGILYELIYSMLFLWISYTILSFVLLDLLRRSMGQIYLDESTAFAKHCDMIDAATSEEPTNNNDESMKVHVEEFLRDIGSLTLPTPSSPESESTQCKVVLTGATGFVGSSLLRDLLFHRERLSLSGGVIVICRPKGTKSARTRVTELLEQPMFLFLSESEKSSLVVVMEGDVTKPLGGLCEDDLNVVLKDDSISHVIHAAAAVGFTQTLPDAARSNITSSLNMQALSMRLPNKDAIYVHISTAFVHGGLNGSKTAPLQEKLFSLDPFNPQGIYESMLTSQFYASKAMTELRFPNTYTFSKCVCEHLLLADKSVTTLVIRPNIVGPAIETPFEGWAGKKPSTIVAGAAFHLSSQWNVWCLERLPVSCIPVDVLSRFILVKAFNLYLCQTAISHETVSSSDSSFEKISRASDTSSDSEEPMISITLDNTSANGSHIILNATWDPSSTDSKSFCWLEFSVAYLQLGCVMGYFSRLCSYLTLFVSASLVPRLRLDKASYERLHYWVVRLPIEVVVRLLDRFGMTSFGVSKVVPFLDLPLLFFPFTKKSFYFQSELVAPDSFNAKRYSFSCGVAAHRFITAITAKGGTLMQRRQISQRTSSSLVVAGEYHHICGSDFTWALSQPKGSYLLRFVAFFVIKILRVVCSTVTVDVASFRNATKHMDVSKSPAHFVLAPTHRSFFDFVLISFILFSLPELQLDIPLIIAADDFERLPLIGWVARMLGAFYVRRGVGFEDRELATRIRSVKEEASTTLPRCFEVFLEGKRSRDRRFVEPRTGFLKSLVESGGEHEVIPMTINYERIPEHKELLWETTEVQSTTNLSMGGLLSWLKVRLYRSPDAVIE